MTGSVLDPLVHRPVVAMQPRDERTRGERKMTKRTKTRRVKKGHTFFESQQKSFFDAFTDYIESCTFGTRSSS